MHIQSIYKKDRGNMRIKRKRGLSNVQLKAVIEYISPINGSQKEIAQRVGVTPKTIRNWNRDPQFREAISEAMDDLRKSAIQSATLSVQIEAMKGMVDYDLKVINDFDVKNTVVELIQNQELSHRKLKEIVEEQKQLRSLLSDLRTELGILGRRGCK